MAENSGKASKVALGAAVGAAAGFVAGILLAPKSGKETREDLKAGAKKAYSAAHKQLNTLYLELTKMIDKADAHVAKLGSAAKKEAIEALAKAHAARDRAATIMAAVKSGNSSDEDLDMAVKNARNALDSLKKYFDTK